MIRELFDRITMLENYMGVIYRPAIKSASDNRYYSNAVSEKYEVETPYMEVNNESSCKGKEEGKD